MTASTKLRPPQARPRRARRRRIPWVVYPILLPSLITLAALEYYPAASGVWHSFFDWRPGFYSTFNGLTNYREMFADDLWWKSFRNLGAIFVASVTVMWALPLLAAELVVTLRSRRLQFWFRTALIIPLAFPHVVTALVWSFLYQPNDGLINRTLRAVGLGGLEQNWVGDPHLALLALIFIGFPWIAGLPFLVFLTALQNIPGELFDAAAVDGAGRLRRLRYVDIPMMMRQAKLLLFLAVISTLQYGFAAYIVTSGGPDNATSVPVLRMLGVAFEGQQWGYAAALSTTLFVITLVVSSLISLLRRERPDVKSL